MHFFVAYSQAPHESNCHSSLSLQFISSLFFYLHIVCAIFLQQVLLTNSNPAFQPVLSPFFPSTSRLYKGTVAAALHRVPAQNGERNNSYTCSSHSSGGGSCKQQLERSGSSRRSSNYRAAAPTLGCLSNASLLDHIVALVLAQWCRAQR